MKRLVIFFCLAISFVAHNSFAQTDSSFLNRAVTSAATYLAANPVEKVYLHLDRAAYLPGDTVWFKAYTVAGIEHGLSALSSILHVEFLTEKDSMVRRMAVLLGSGLGRGDIPIPANILPGRYHVRAYTNWMRNASPDYFYDQYISVSITQSALVGRPGKLRAGIDVQFFPEGGSLVAGARIKVAVKATNKAGLGEEISGSVVDDDGNEVSAFQTQRLGMGAFAMIAQPGKKYSAVITTKNNEKITRPLPAVSDDGFALAVFNNNADSIAFKVTASDKLFAANKGGTYYLLAQAGGKVLYTTSFTLSAQSFMGRVDKLRFASGIVQFTLFAQQGEPLNERIVFVQRAEDNVKLSVKTEKNVYGTRQKVSLAVKAADALGKPQEGSFSASVVCEELAGQENTALNNIYSGLLLTSEIKGYVQDPGYYFTNITDKTRADLDLLMLTQGYRRFSWKEVMDGSYPPNVFLPEASLDIQGHVVLQGGAKPTPYPKIRLLSARGSAFGADTVGDKDGRFVIKGLHPDTSMRYMVQGRTAGGRDYVAVTLDTLADMKSWKEPANVEIATDTTDASSYKKQAMQQLKMRLDRQIISLKEVVITSQRKKTAPMTNADQILTNLPENGITSLSSYLSSKLIGITFQMQRDGTFALFSNRSIMRRNPPSPMSIILDGFPIDGVVFSTLNVADIESVQVLRTSGKRDIVTGLSDVVVITSKRGVRPAPPKPDQVAFKSYGVYKEKQFYSPVYGEERPAYTKPDLRTTIYWKADVITDKEGNASLSFYNADTKGTYRVTIEGLDVDGHLGRQVFSYKVE